MNLEQWVTLEQRIRQAQSIKALQLLVVNSLQQVIPYTQSALIERIDAERFSVCMLSHISDVNTQSPIVRWMEHALAPWLWAQKKAPSFFLLNEVPGGNETDTAHSPYGLFIPLTSPAVGDYGLVLWFHEEQDPSLAHAATLIAEALVHAWERLIALKKKTNRPAAAFFKKRWKWIALVTILLLFFIRLNENTIAPAEVIPLNPVLITPSINGTIRSIEVKPNQAVKKGQVLVTLDDITLRNQMEEAQKELQVAEQRYLKAYHHAYNDTSQAQNSLQEMSVLQEEKEQARLKLEYQKQLLERTELKSPVDGVALYSDPKELLGKPVRVGEKIMLLASPNEKELAFWIAMDNMIDVQYTHPIHFFSNEHPATRSQADIQYINPIAEARPDGVVAYYGVAQFAKNQPLKLGEQGVVKLFGSKVSLFYYLTRRPIRYLRQHLGV